jgi:hypothetical protein
VDIVPCDAKGLPQEAGMVLSLPYIYCIGFDISTDHEQWEGFATHMEPFSLADGEKMGARVATDDFTVVSRELQRNAIRQRVFRPFLRADRKGWVIGWNFNDVAFPDFELLLQKRGKFDFSDKTEALAVFFLRGGKGE